MSTVVIFHAAALAYAGLGALSLTNARHHGDVYGRAAALPAGRMRMLTLSGWLALACSFVAAIASAGWHLGPVLWCGLLFAAAMAQALLLWVAPRAAPRMVLLLGAAGTLSGLLAASLPA